MHKSIVFRSDQTPSWKGGDLTTKERRKLSGREVG